MSSLPRGWVQAKFTDVFEIHGGRQPPKSMFRYEPQPEYIQLLQIRDFGENPVPTYIFDEKNLRKCTEQDILIARYGASLGRILTGQSGAYNVAMVKVDIPEEIYRQFVYHLLNSETFQGPLRLLSRSAQSGFNKQDLSNIDLPFPPLAEQKRIADKLDTLLARVDACRARLDHVRVILKQFRQAVLAAATSGVLTEEWRAENFGTSINESGGNSFDFGDADCFGDYCFPSTWKTVCLGDVAEVKTGITKNSKKQDASYDEVPYLRVANVQRGYFDLSEVKTIRVPPTRTEELLLKPGDILFNEGGDIDKLGRGWVWSGELEHCVFQNHVFRARLRNSHFNPKFFSHYGNSRGIDYFLTYGKQTTNLASISKSVLTALPIVVPPADEQHEIVRRVETLFAFAERLQRHTQTALTKVEHLTTALLDKAFRGEFVPQDPNDEPASVLLERIRAERALQPNKPKRTRRPKRSKMSKNSVKKAIKLLPQDHFSFDELRDHLSGNYEKLKDIIFALLDETEPSITQLFDESSQTMHFVRSNR